MIGFQHHRDGFFEVGSRLCERRPLRIGTGQFPGERYVAFGHAHVNGCELRLRHSRFIISAPIRLILICDLHRFALG